MPWGSNEEIAIPASQPLTAPQPEVTVTSLIAQWDTAQQSVAFWKAKEHELRQQLVKLCFNPTIEKGTEHISVDGGWTLTCVKKLTYNLDSEKVEAALASFSDDMANLLVKWSASLSAHTYDRLSDEQKALFNDVLTTKPGMPSLELKPPK